MSIEIHKKEYTMNKKTSSSKEKRYTIKEWDDGGKKCGNYEVYAVSHLGALRKLYPNDSFELFSQSNSLNRIKCPGKDFHFEVSNHYGCSTQNKTRLYKRISNK